MISKSEKVNHEAVVVLQKLFHEDTRVGELLSFESRLEPEIGFGMGIAKLKKDYAVKDYKLKTADKISAFNLYEAS